MATKRISDAIDAIGFGPAQAYTLILAHGIWFADGVELTLVTALTEAISRDFSLTHAQMASLTSIVFWGIACGCWLSGYFDTSIGRRGTVLCCYAFVAIWGTVSACTSTFGPLVCVRYLMGVSMGMGMPTSLALVSEMSPQPWRIPLMGMRGFCYSLGSLFAAFIIVVDDASLKNLHWRRDFLIAVLPPVILGFFASLFLQESPVYLEANGRHEEADKVVKWIMRNNCVHHNIKLDYQSLSNSRTSTPSCMAKLRTVFSRHLAYTTGVLCMCTFTINFVEYGSAYAEPYVLQQTNASIAAGWQLVLKYVVKACVTLAMVLPAVAFNRRVAMILGLVGGCSLGAWMFAWSGAKESRNFLLETDYYCSQYLPLVGIALTCMLVYQFSVDTYPAHAVATGTGVVVGVGRLGSILAPWIFETFRASSQPWQGFYYMMAILSALVAFFIPCLPDPSDSSSAASEDTLMHLCPSKDAEVGLVK